jgi:hypothetical protein
VLRYVLSDVVVAFRVSLVLRCSGRSFSDPLFQWGPENAASGYGTSCLFSGSHTNQCLRL